MSDKLRRAVAIIALILMSLFTILLIIYIFDKDKTLLNGAVGELTIWTGAFGLILTLVLWLSHSFPAQQRKDEERDRLYKEAEEAQNAQDEKSNDEKPNDEKSDVSNDQTRDKG